MFFYAGIIFFQSLFCLFHFVQGLSTCFETIIIRRNGPFPWFPYFYGTSLGSFGFFDFGFFDLGFFGFGFFRLGFFDFGFFDFGFFDFGFFDLGFLGFFGFFAPGFFAEGFLAVGFFEPLLGFDSPASVVASVELGRSFMQWQHPTAPQRPFKEVAARSNLEESALIWRGAARLTQPPSPSNCSAQPLSTHQLDWLGPN